MITKTISGIKPEHLPMVMANLKQVFTIKNQTQDSVTAAGSEEHWQSISLPKSVTIIQEN